MPIQEKLKFIDKNASILEQRLIDFLKIQSISTDKFFAKSCDQAAEWLVGQLQALNFQVKAHQTEGHPIVLANGGEGSPHLLFYGHYDVQPADPLDAWDSAPFEPKIKFTKNGNAIFARGASDDKGQLMTFINACTAFMRTDGKLPCKITLLIEGEEETGSPSIETFIKSNKSFLQADYALVCDTSMWDSKTPAISTMLRGMLGEEINLKTANKDVHSGIYGGAILNPIKELAKAIASLHDENGKVMINNFYNGVSETPKFIKNQWEKLNFSSENFLADVGLKCSVGEASFSLLEQIWARPTCEVNGIWGGYTATGFKTVIPSEANAKVSFRLVGHQDPEEIRANFRKHLKNNVHKDCKLNFISKDGSKAISIPVESFVIKKAKQALFEEWGSAPVFIGCGGSIPIVGAFKEMLGLDTLLVGFALEDDRIHSPNEKYDLRSYHKGAKSWIRILDGITN
tara:strand:- start:782 stop:2155 length:1374 start_codon:yes stop_codon:yes gene_type:complete